MQISEFTSFFFFSLYDMIIQTRLKAFHRALRATIERSKSCSTVFFFFIFNLRGIKEEMIFN